MKSPRFTIFLILATLIISLSWTKAATCHRDDEAGLLAFKAGITQDPVGFISDWKKGTPCCSWNGITCLTDRVTELRLSGRTSSYGDSFFTGTISPLLAKLDHLEALSFIYFLNMSVPFPQFIFRLPKLKYVTIKANRLSGPLPANIGALSQLEELDLGDNRLIGPIPSSISNLTRLTMLNLGGNRLSGTIPDVFKSMSKLGTLHLSRNGFTGKLPPSTESLEGLMHLYLAQNNLSGTIPNYFSRFNWLYILDLSRNQFSGAVPVFKSVYHLNLSHNLLTGPFPDLTTYEDGITTLDLSHNKFKLKKIPKWVTSSYFISELKLVKCGIKMNMSDWEPVRPNSYYTIDLSENNISGSPSRFLSQAEELQEFQASGNKLRFDMEKLNFTQFLRIMDLSRNLVYGKVPASVDGVEILNLSQNHLCGKLPVTKFPASVFAGNDYFISELKLVKCGIKMNMSDWEPVRPNSYYTIDLSENNISGSPSRFLTQAEELQEFQASGNKLRFDMEKLNFIQFLRIMDLSRNLVYGKVPASVDGVEILNLSQNHLCGKLPVTKFPASVFAGNDCLCGFPLSSCKA